MMVSPARLHWLDWMVLCLYALSMLLIGFYFARRNKSAEDYLLGGRNMQSWRVGLSLFATLFSAVSYLSMPGEMIKHGPMMWCMIFAIPLIYLVVSRFFIPFVMQQKISSAYELLEARLGRPNRILASVFFLGSRLIWMALIIYLCAEKIIVPILGWSPNTALGVSVAIGMLTVVYTSFGGLRGVVLTDVLQSFILFGGGILAILTIIYRLGGFTAIIPSEWPAHWDGWVFFNPQARVSFVTVVLAVFGWNVCTAGSDQMAIQRYLATENIRTARRMYLSSLLAIVFVYFLLAALGLSVMAFFQHHPAFIPGGTTLQESADLLFPLFIVMGLPAGFSGLVLAGLLAAAMSSLSSGINSSCLVVIQDLIIPAFPHPISEKRQLRLAKFISVGIGIFIVLISLVIGNIQGNLLEVTYKTVNLLVGPLFVPFFVAMFVRRARPVATFIGTLISALVAVSISFSSEIFSVSISFLWNIPGSFFAGVLTSWFLSWIFKK